MLIKGLCIHPTVYSWSQSNSWLCCCCCGGLVPRVVVEPSSWVEIRVQVSSSSPGGCLPGGVRSSPAGRPRRCPPWTGPGPRSWPAEGSPPPGPRQTEGLGGEGRHTHTHTHGILNTWMEASAIVYCYWLYLMVVMNDWLIFASVW